MQKKKSSRWTVSPQVLPDWESRLREPNQTKRHANERRWHGEEERGQKKRGWKPCRTVPWHLNPGCCLFLTAQRQIALQDGDYWPLGHYHLNFPGCIPVKQKNRVLSWIITSRNMLWEKERKKERAGWREGRSSWYFLFREDMQWRALH